MIIWWAWNNFW